jgi:general stress protein 26
MTNTANDAGRARTLMDETGIAKPVTCDGAKLRARPMAAFIERNDTAICMLTDARRHTDEEIAQHPDINLSFADTGGRKYVSVTGAATVGNDGINRKVAI